MPCSSCVDKLAFKLIRHHKLDLIRAYELAEKAVKRVENRVVEPQKPEIMSGKGNPSDYSQNCTGTGGTAPCDDAGQLCASSIECSSGVGSCSGGTCWCPDPLPNSHQVSIGCYSNPTQTCKYCSARKCRSVANCTCYGQCYYDCDTGYMWNPVTLECELAAALASKRLLVGVGV